MIAIQQDYQRAKNKTCLRLKIGRIQIDLHSVLDELFDDFSMLYHGCQKMTAKPNRVEEDGLEPATHITMEIKQGDRSRFGRQRFSIFGDGESMYANRKQREVLPYLEWGINWRLVAKCNAYLQLHAATVSRFGQGMMLAAYSGSGKSTLTAALLSRGWQYFCDELSLIDPQTLEIQPFPKALCIKSGSFDLVEQMNLPLWRRGHYVKAFKGPVGYINPMDVPNYKAATPCPLRYVILPQYRGGVRPNLEPISSSEAVFALAQQTMNRKHFGAQLVSVLSHAVRGAQCFKLEVGRLEETCEVLEGLVGEVGA